MQFNINITHTPLSVYDVPSGLVLSGEILSIILENEYKGDPVFLSPSSTPGVPSILPLYSD